MAESKANRGWVSLHPDDLKGAALALEAVYDLRRPQDSAQDIANWRMATDPQHPAMTDEMAASRYLGVENWGQVERGLLVQSIRRDPEILGVLKQLALADAVPELRQKIAGAGNTGIDAATLQSINPDLAQMLAQSAVPGMPGFGAAQQMLQGGQTMGPGQPPPPTGGAAPQPPFAQPIESAGQGGGGMPMPTPQRGRPPGMARSPGGPRRTGGL